MKLILSKTDIAKAPKGYTRIAFVPEKGVRRLVRENGTETIELSLPEKMSRRKFIILCRSVVTVAKQFKAKKIAISLMDLAKDVEETDVVRLSQLAAENFELANFEFRTYKTKPKEGWNEASVC